MGLFRKRRLFRAAPLGVVVPRASANPGLAGHVVHDVDEDHITIAKPSSRDHVLFRGVQRFIEEVASSAAQALIPNADPGGDSHAAEPPRELFLSYAGIGEGFIAELVDSLRDHDGRLKVSTGVDWSPSETIVPNSAVVVSLWNDASVASLWAEAEADVGLRGAGLVVVRLDDVQIPDRFEDGLIIEASDHTRTSDLADEILRVAALPRPTTRAVASAEVDFVFIGPRTHEVLRRPVLVALSASEDGRCYAELQGFPDLIVVEPTADAALASLVELLAETNADLQSLRSGDGLSRSLEVLARKLERVVADG